jgi:uncharacterized protein (TIGR02246 family)
MRPPLQRVALVTLAATLLVTWASFGQTPKKSADPAPKKTAPPAAKPPADAPANQKPTTPADKPTATKPAADQPAASTDADEAAIRKGAAAFVAAYNAHDAKALAALFALKAEFTDEDGNLIRGREAIEQSFADVFKQYPDGKIEVEVESVRVLTPNIAVEEGIVRGQPVPDEAANLSSYVAVNVKVDGKWLIASVHDYEADAAELTANDYLQELDWMVGDWVQENPDSVVKSSCRWDESGNYLLHDFSLQMAGGLNASGSMRIGWDPLTRQIKSWTFDANSGYSEGLWTRVGDEWIVKARGVNSAGHATTATNVYRYVDAHTMTLRSYDRTVAGEPGAEVVEFVIKRQAPPPAE